MKLLSKVFVGLMMCGVLFVAFGLRASAADNLEVYITSERLTNAAIALIPQESVRSELEEGDVQVSFCVRNNTGFGNCGMSFDYDAENYQPIFQNNSSSQLLYQTGVAGDNLIIALTHGSDTHKIGIAAMGGLNVSVADGVIVSFYLHPITSNPPANPVEDYNINSIASQPYIPEQQYVLVLDRYYICGDIDDDGDIDADDGGALLRILESVNVVIDENNFQSYFSGIPEFAVIDVDGNGEVNFDDTDCILMFYMDVILMQNPLGEYGNIGSLVAHYISVLI